MTELGKPVFVPLDRVRTHRNTDKRGTFRWCNDYRLPEHLGGGVVTVRLHANVEDAKRWFNRAENVRQMPPGDPDSKCCTGDATTPSPSTGTSTTRCGCGGRTASATVGSC